MQDGAALLTGVEAGRDSVTISETVTAPDGQTYKVVGVDAGAFRNAAELAGLSVPVSLCGSGLNEALKNSAGKQTLALTISGEGEVPAAAFDGNDRLAALSLGAGITAVGDGAFQNCSALASVESWGAVQAIGDAAFAGCAFAVLELSAAEIGDGAFADCRQLQYLIIDEGVSTLGARAFSGCGELQNLIFAADIVSVGDAAFEGCRVRLLYYPAGNYDQWTARYGSTLQACGLSYEAFMTPAPAV